MTSIQEIARVNVKVTGARGPFGYTGGNSSAPFLDVQSRVGVLERKVGDVVNVMEHGATGNGVTDDRAAIVAAVAAARGKRLVFPKGNYLIDTDGGSIVVEEVEISGQDVLDGANVVVDQGVNFFITGTTNSPFKQRRGGSFEGLGFYYPNQGDTATPTVYPPTIDGDFSNGAIQFANVRNCVVYNAYDFIRWNDASNAVGHVWITDNTIFAFRRAISLSGNVEVIKIEGNTFTYGVWNVATNAGAASFYRANGVNIYAETSDGLWIENNLFFGALSGIHGSVTGLCQQISVVNNSFDQTRYGIRANGSGNFLGNITGNGFYTQNTQAPTLQGRSIEILTTGNLIDNAVIVGNQFNLSSENHIYVAGVGPARRDIVVTGNIFRAWGYGKTSGGWGAIEAENVTNLIASGNSFDAYLSVYASGIVGAMNSLQCSGNWFLQCQSAVNVTTTYLAGSGNSSYATASATSDIISATFKTWGPNQFDKPQDKSPMTISLNQIGDFANDTAAALGGVGLGGLYRNGSIRMIRAT